MDPITGAVVAIALYAVSIPASFFILGLLFAFIAGAIDDDLIGLGGFVGIVLSWGWTVFALIQGLIQLVRVIQLIAFPEMLGT